MAHELESYEWGIIPIRNYKGVLVEKIIGGYKVLGKTVIRPEEVDDIINQAGESLRNSIVIDRSNGAFDVVNDLG